MMNQHDVPEYQWENVQSILKACRTAIEDPNQGRFRASINNMSYDELRLLRKNIERL